MTHFIRPALLILALMLPTACKTSESTPAPAAANQATTPAPKDDMTALVARVEALRDQSFSTPPTFTAHEGAIPDSILGATELPAPVTAAYQALARHLNAEVMNPSEGAKVPPAPSATWAVYEASTHTIHHVKAQSAARRGALVRALVTALDLQERVLPETLDAWMAQRALTEGNAMFVSIVHELELTTDRELTAQAISQTPSLLWAHPAAQAQLGTSLYGAPDLLKTTYSFTQREGAGFMAAMVRSHGWSGAEVAMSSPPRHTAQIIDPERWLEGSSDATWTLPQGWVDAQEGWVEQDSGRVGAAWTTMWLAMARGQASKKATDAQPSAHVRTLAELTDQALQVIPASWRADQWKTWRKGERSLFAWVSQWEAPTSASYVARQLDAGIAMMHELQPNLAMRCAVAHEGLQIAVLCSDDQDKATLEGSANTLTRKARAAYLTIQDLPLKYKPYTAETLLKSAAKMTLSKETLRWNDPGLNLSADLSRLGGSYTPQTTDTGLVRWYAVHDGATIQFTAEPMNPLSPEFSSKAYATELSDKLLATLPQGKLTAGEGVSHPTLGQGHTLSFEAVFNGVPHQLHLWHMQRDGSVLTMSINAPKDRAAQVKALAEQVFSSITSASDEATP